ncbi:MAG: hypothetical protein DWG77_04065 [Chloroflexi bacterium]|nr:hypothetical protein [Chloroflexota bacterium]
MRDAPDNERGGPVTPPRSLLPRWSSAAILPRLVAGLALAVALGAWLLRVDTGQSWLGLASIAVVLVEIERRTPARSAIRPLTLVNIAARVSLVVVAVVAVAVALPLQWWLPMALTVGVVRASQALGRRMVVLTTTTSAAFYLGVVALSTESASAHESSAPVGLLPELVVGRVLFPTLAALVYRWSSRSRSRYQRCSARSVT